MWDSLAAFITFPQTLNVVDSFVDPGAHVLCNIMAGNSNSAGGSTVSFPFMYYSPNFYNSFKMIVNIISPFTHIHFALLHGGMCDCSDGTLAVFEQSSLFVHLLFQA